MKKIIIVFWAITLVGCSPEDFRKIDKVVLDTDSSDGDIGILFCTEGANDNSDSNSGCKS